MIDSINMWQYTKYCGKSNVIRWQIRNDYFIRLVRIFCILSKSEEYLQQVAVTCNIAAKIEWKI